MKQTSSPSWVASQSIGPPWGVIEIDRFPIVRLKPIWSRSNHRIIIPVHYLSYLTGSKLSKIGWIFVKHLIQIQILFWSYCIIDMRFIQKSQSPVNILNNVFTLLWRFGIDCWTMQTKTWNSWQNNIARKRAFELAERNMKRFAILPRMPAEWWFRQNG